MNATTINIAAILILILTVNPTLTAISQEDTPTEDANVEEMIEESKRKKQ